MQFCRIARAAWIRRSFTKAGKYKLLWLLHGGNSDDTAWQRKTMIEVCAKEKISSSLCRKRTTLLYQLAGEPGAWLQHV